MGSVCVLGHTSTLSQAVCDSAFAFTSRLCRTSRLTQGNMVRPSLVVSEHAHNPGHAYSPTQACSLPDPREYVPAFQSSLWTCHATDFFHKSFDQNLVCLNCSFLLQAATMFSCLWLFSTNVHGEKVVFAGEF